MRKLEETYGVQLFIRAPRGVDLTETGRKLYTITERQFEAEARGPRTADAGAGRWTKARLTIGADAAVHVLPQVARFRLKHPRIAVRLVTGNSAELLEAA